VTPPDVGENVKNNVLRIAGSVVAVIFIIGIRAIWTGSESVEGLATELIFGGSLLIWLYYEIKARRDSGTRPASDDVVSEDQCVLCSGLRPSEREGFRSDLCKIPLREPVCAACTMTFFRNIGFPVSDAEPTKQIAGRAR
jgi:hypothetical protein